MRLLLDEDIDVRLRNEFSGNHEVETVQYRGWKGLTNGELLKRASGEFDVLLTMDDSLPDQQKLAVYEIGVVILRARSKDLRDLAELIPAVEEQLSQLNPGTATRVYPPQG